MGSSASKAASKAPQAAAAAGRRQYPSTSSILNSATSTSNAPSYAGQTHPPPSSYTNATPQSERPPAPSQVRPNPETSPPSSTKSSQIDIDGRDPQFSSALRRLGPAVSVDQTRGPKSGAFPTSSQPPLGQQGQNIFPSTSSGSNPALMIVTARERIAKQYEMETENLGRASFGGKTLLSARELNEVIRLKSMGRVSAEIEKQMRLKPGVVDELGAGVVVSNV